MSGERLEVSVTFDPAEPITALSLAVLQRRIEERLLPDSIDVRLNSQRGAVAGGCGPCGRPVSPPASPRKRAVSAFSGADPG
jgi:hypothetical protein